MSTLVNFEQKYGMTDIICKIFLNKYIDKEKYEEKINGITIRCGLASQGIFRPTGISKEYSKIIFVYDMNKLDIFGVGSILESKDLEEKINILENYYKNIELYFVPVIYTAETICMYIMDNTTPYISYINKYSTMNMHTEICRNLLENKFPYNQYPSFWKKYGKNKTKSFKIKCTRNFFDYLGNITNNIKSNYSDEDMTKFNRTLFNWILTKNIEDTTYLLSGQDAIKRQIEFEKYFKERENIINLVGKDDFICIIKDKKYFYLTKY